MKTKTIVIILVILALIAAVYFATKKPKTDTMLDTDQSSMNGLQNQGTGLDMQTGIDGTAPVVQEQQPTIVEPMPAEEAPVAPEFPTTGVKPE